MRGKLVAKVCVQLHVLCAVQWNNCILLPFCLRLGRLKGLGLQEASWIFEAASVPSPIALSRCSARGIVPFWGEVYDAQLESRVRVLRTVFFKLLEPSPFLYYVAFAHSCLCQQFKFICKLRMLVLWLGLFFSLSPLGVLYEKWLVAGALCLHRLCVLLLCSKAELGKFGASERLVLQILRSWVQVQSLEEQCVLVLPKCS